MNDLIPEDLILYYLKSDMQNILERSYSHQNGFFKIVLYKSLTCQIRLHIWEGSKEIDENVHDHRFHFTSKILLGKYSEEIFEPDKCGIDYFAYEYAPINEKEYSLIPTVNMKLNKVSVNTYNEGQIISRSASILHKVTPQSNVVVSLLISSGNVKEKCLVLNNKKINTEVIARHIMKSELLYILREYLKINI